MKRAIVLILDSFGIGAAADAVDFGDAGADTLGHIVEECAKGSLARGPLQLPELAKLGLEKAHALSTNQKLAHSLADNISIIGSYGYAAEISHGKDTPSGHWEMMGVPVLFDWGYFPTQAHCFPQELIDQFITEAKLPGVIGEKHASGTEIIKELGEEHIKTGKPIVYTSADSVFQIAAHEQHFGLERLYEICHIARKLVDPYNIGRVIARPFIGEVGHFKRTANRMDLAVPPPGETLLDLMLNNGQQVISIGKIADIFAHRGISECRKAPDNDGIFNETLKALKSAPDGSIVFSNFVDFDSSYGHRRDVKGYADALEAFDKRLPELYRLMNDEDILVISADHGCDPTRAGSDHTREHIPVLMYGKKLKAIDLGGRDTFADIGQTLASFFKLAPLNHGITCPLF